MESAADMLAHVSHGGYVFQQPSRPPSENCMPIRGNKHGHSTASSRLKPPQREHRVIRERVSAGTIRSSRLGFTSAKKFGAPMRLRRERRSVAEPSPVELAKAALAAKESGRLPPRPSSPIRSTKLGSTDAGARLTGRDSQALGTSLGADSDAAAAVAPSPARDAVGHGVIRSFKEGQTTASPLAVGSKTAGANADGNPAGEPDFAEVGVIRSRSFGLTTASIDTHHARDVYSEPDPNAPKTQALATGVIRSLEPGHTSATARLRDELHAGINAYKLQKAEEELDSLLVRDAPSPPKYSFIRSSILGGTNATTRVRDADAPDNEDKIQAFRQRDNIDASEGLTIYASGKKGYTTRSIRKHESPSAEMVKDLITSRPAKVGWSPATIRMSALAGRNTATFASRRPPPPAHEAVYPDKPLTTRDPSVRIVGYSSHGGISTPVIERKTAPSVAGDSSVVPVPAEASSDATPVPGATRASASSSRPLAKQLEFDVSTTPSARKGRAASQRLFARGTVASNHKGKRVRIVTPKRKAPRPSRRAAAAAASSTAAPTPSPGAAARRRTPAPAPARPRPSSATPAPASAPASARVAAAQVLA
ncbi:uncharacterized protein AMSG_02337 [Thecamonas trahens ATCC 50062]|uniref:Uncharacterized protein n=1 Tax=Thecamonas trahens ATCC 50062 TaxID=461836 RepID=A0A0L0DW17_THETB|nr:hypothetical protein AMSG_02337 [Thecamonas trahens ATCC 50062]KNC56367.1 hypothetical protein AMSG_02337 [Thecamonas trahens ATCC 50062]|eukprot:XP_013760882.1 hypothetical protein AMSG_02337 [Thecamonas trahens ATCC 50062]